MQAEGSTAEGSTAVANLRAEGSAGDSRAAEDSMPEGWPAAVTALVVVVTVTALVVAASSGRGREPDRDWGRPRTR